MDNLLSCLDDKTNNKPVSCVMKHVPTWFDKSAAYFKAKPEHAAQLKDKNVDEDSKKLFGDKLKDNSSPIEIPIKPDEKPTKPDEKPKPNQDEE